MAGQPRWHLSIIVLLTINSSLFAKLDLTGNASLGWPIGGYRSYSYGSTCIGATIRSSTNISSFSKIFVQARILDFGLTYGYIPRDNIYSDSGLESVTDSYTFSILPGIAFGTVLGGAIPYVNILCGYSRHATLSRINSLDIPDIVEYLEDSRSLWQYGAGAGLRVVMWENTDMNNRRLLNSIAFDFRVEYLTGGKLEYLDRRTIRYKAGQLQYDMVEFKNAMAVLNAGFSVKF